MSFAGVIVVLGLTRTTGVGAFCADYAAQGSRTASELGGFNATRSNSLDHATYQGVRWPEVRVSVKTDHNGARPHRLRVFEARLEEVD